MNNLVNKTKSTSKSLVLESIDKQILDCNKKIIELSIKDGSIEYAACLQESYDGSKCEQCPNLKKYCKGVLSIYKKYNQ